MPSCGAGKAVRSINLVRGLELVRVPGCRAVQSELMKAQEAASEVVEVGIYLNQDPGCGEVEAGAV